MWFLHLLALSYAATRPTRIRCSTNSRYTHLALEVLSSTSFGRRIFDKLIIGQNLELTSDKFAMTRKVLKGDAFAVLNQNAHAAVEQNNHSCTKHMERLSKRKNVLSHHKACSRRSEDVIN